jgi:hypothetical protein
MMSLSIWLLTDQVDASSRSLTSERMEEVLYWCSKCKLKGHRRKLLINKLLMRQSQAPPTMGHTKDSLLQTM